MTAKRRESEAMEDYTLDEDGNQVSVLHPPSPHRSETETIDLSTGAENGDGDGQARVDMPDGLDDLVDIFGIEGRGYDVTLSVTQRTLTWVPMNPSSGGGKHLFSLVNFENMRRSSPLSLHTYSDILCCKIPKLRLNDSSTDKMLPFSSFTQFANSGVFS